MRERPLLYIPPACSRDALISPRAYVRRPAEAKARAARRAQGVCKQAAFDRLVRRSIERRRSTVQSGPVRRLGRTHGRCQ